MWLLFDRNGHHISAQGIEPNKSKIQKILYWPVPTNPTEVQTFLGLIRYIAVFLPKLMDHMLLLTPLTNKMARSDFSWTGDHQLAFESIKALVISADCLTIIDHTNPEKRTKSSSPMMQVTGVQELAWPLKKLGKLPPLLYMIQCNLVLQKKLSNSWKRATCNHQSTKEVVLLGAQFTVYTDHHMKTSTPNVTYWGTNCDGKSLCFNMRWISYTSPVRTIVLWTLCLVFQKGHSLVKKWVTQLHLLHMKHGDTPLALCSPSWLTNPCLSPSKLVTFQTISVCIWPKVTCLGLTLSIAYGISGTTSLSPGLVIYVRICFSSLTTL